MKARFLDLSEELKSASNPDIKSDFEEFGVKYTLGDAPYTIYAITCNRNLIIFDDIDGYVNIYVKGHFRGKPFGDMVASIDCRESNLKKREAKIRSFVKKLSNMSVSQLDRFLNANADDIEFLNLKPFNRYIRNSHLSENLEFTDGPNFYDDAKRTGIFTTDRNFFRLKHLLYTCDDNYNCLAVMDDEGLSVYGRTDSQGIGGDYAGIIASIRCSENKAKSFLVSLSKIISNPNQILDFCERNHFKIDKELLKDWFRTVNEAISLADSKDKDIRKILTKWHFDPVLKKSLIKGLSLSDGKKALYAEIFDGKVLVLVNHSEYGNDSGVYLYLRAKTRKGFPYNLGILHGLTPASARSMFMRIARITDAERLVDFMSKNRFTTFSDPVKKFLDAFENQ